ncbi:hypothetical protein PRIPAC_94443 [Pristionchus pacificus]|uniref:Uncharacterized protein n=1 Tax=Pristionchus pacificus TaxID=54126 RepID=A0A2A6CI39_PRIPA|nr:hypothetical protein PRIPAC_94443 [Pristionchus pacificus]|eukprot:PDM77885.1 hypothetical protein PRIPAC_34752 [Pristionchus pacificus]
MTVGKKQVLLHSAPEDARGQDDDHSQQGRNFSCRSRSLKAKVVWTRRPTGCGPGVPPGVDQASHRAPFMAVWTKRPTGSRKTSAAQIFTQGEARISSAWTRPIRLSLMRDSSISKSNMAAIQRYLTTQQIQDLIFIIPFYMEETGRDDISLVPLNKVWSRYLPNVNLLPTDSLNEAIYWLQLHNATVLPAQPTVQEIDTLQQQLKNLGGTGAAATLVIAGVHANNQLAQGGAAGGRGGAADGQDGQHAN